MIDTSGLPHFCLSVVPGRVRILDDARNPLSSWNDTLFYTEWVGEYQMLVHMLKTVRWHLPYLAAKDIAGLQYQSDAWNTSVNTTATGPHSNDGWVQVNPEDWTLEVLEDFVLDRPIRRDMERLSE